MTNEYTDPNTNSVYDDGNIPEIDLPKSDNAVTIIPPEFGTQNGTLEQPGQNQPIEK